MSTSAHHLVAIKDGVGPSTTQTAVCEVHTPLPKLLLIICLTRVQLTVLQLTNALAPMTLTE